MGTPESWGWVIPELPAGYSSIRDYLKAIDPHPSPRFVTNAIVPKELLEPFTDTIRCVLFSVLKDDYLEIEINADATRVYLPEIHEEVAAELQTLWEECIASAQAAFQRGDWCDEA